MMDFFNQVVATIAQLVVAGAGTAFMVYGIPYLKKIGVYKLVQIRWLSFSDSFIAWQ